MNPESYRHLFPVTMQKIYLNHAAISPMSVSVTDKIEWFLDERCFGSIDPFKLVSKEREKTRQLVAKLIHANPSQIAFISNTSEGFNHLVQGLDWRPGDQIVIPDCEFPSNVYPFLNLRNRGVEVVFVPCPDGKVNIERIEDYITPHTRLLSVSFVEFSSGFRNDLLALGEICRRHGIIFSVDGIQGVGALDLDVTATGIHFLSNGGHKWLMAPMGTGFMYIAPELFELLHPAFTGWLAMENAWKFLDYDFKLLPDCRRFEYATANFMGLMGMQAAVELLLTVGLPEIEMHLLMLGEMMVDALSELGLRFINHHEKKHWSGIYSFRAEKSTELFKYLQEKGVICSLRNGLLRFAPHFYNTREEIEEVITLIKDFYHQ